MSPIRLSSPPHTMVVCGVMSGTSADGIDTALVRISPGLHGSPLPRLKLIAHRGFPYPRPVRAAVLAAMNAGAINVAELARLDWRLGELYADAVAQTCSTLLHPPDLIGLHGQTIYHQATAARYLGRSTCATWQIGEAAVISQRLRVPVVSDFRPADLAAGGQGAPLVPMLDLCLFRSTTRHRILLNLGGIANLTAIPAGAGLADLLAFDTGPANMVVDQLMHTHFGKAFDRAGKTAARGRVLEDVVAELLNEPYFHQPPPRSCGREEFGAAFARRVQTLCADASPADQVATATELTARSIADAIRHFVLPHLAHRAPAKRMELIAAGGGVQNVTLFNRLTTLLKAEAIRVLPAEAAGMPSQAKEAVAFALLAWLRWHGLPGNVPAATGARTPAVLGQVSLW